MKRCDIANKSAIYVLVMQIFLLYNHPSSYRHFDIADKENGPKSVNDIKLINAGKILENNRTLAESRTPLSEVPGGVITMLVVVRPQLPDKHSGKLTNTLCPNIVYCMLHL